MARDPGWYADPEGKPETQRWWDGGTWSHVTRPAPPGSMPPPRSGWSAPPRRQDPGTSGALPGTTSENPYHPPGAHPPPGGYPPGGYPGQYQGRAVITPDGVPLAGLGARLVARIIDWVLVSTLSVIVGFPYLQTVVDAFSAWFDDALQETAAGRPTPPINDLLRDSQVEQAMANYSLITAVIAAGYTIVLLRVWGATVGKRLLGIAVRSWDSPGLPSWGQATLRWLTGEGIGALFSPYLLANFAWPLWDKKRQALHDKLPGTVVVLSRGRPATPS